MDFLASQKEHLKKRLITQQGVWNQNEMAGRFRRLPLLIYSLLEENTEENTETIENNNYEDG